MPARLFPKGKLSAPLPSLKAYKALSEVASSKKKDKALVLSFEPTGAALASVAVNPPGGFLGVLKRRMPMFLCRARRHFCQPRSST